MYKVHHIHNDTEICRPDQKKENDLFIYEVGHNTPPPGYASNQNDRDMFVLHYVINGKGRFYKERIDGPCIVIFPPDVIQYYSLDNHPQNKFEQYWIMFGGADAKKLLEQGCFPTSPKVIPCPYIYQAVQILRELQTPHYYVGKDDNLLMIAGLYQLMALQHAHVCGEKKKYGDRVQKLVDHIQEHYATLITEDSLADIVNLSTRYMHRIFKSETGVSPIQYLNAYRIHCAKKLLLEDNIPINAVALACGFTTHNYFCAVFRKHNNGLSPLEYRKRHQ